TAPASIVSFETCRTPVPPLRSRARLVFLRHLISSSPQIISPNIATSFGARKSELASPSIQAPPDEVARQQRRRRAIQLPTQPSKRLNVPGPSFPDTCLWCSNRLSRRAICTIGDIREVPSSPEGAIKIDEICRNQRVAVGKIIFALQQLGLCRDDIQEIDRTLRVTLPGGLQSGLIFSDGPGDIGTPVLRFAIGRQGVVDLLPGQQDRLLKKDGRFPLSRFAQRQGAPQPPAFEDRNGNRRPQSERDRGRGKQIAQVQAF